MPEGTAKGVSHINKTRWILLVLILCLIGAVALCADSINEYYVKSKLDPQVELQRSTSNMAAVNSYRYNLKSGYSVDKRKEVISRVEGEKDHGNTHIKGEMVNTPVDIYYIDGTIYNYDSFSGRWLEIDSGTQKAEELLISELNPLSNFRFKKVNNIKKNGFEKIDGTECLVVKCEPEVQSQLLETMWKDFEYCFWIDYKKGLVQQANLRATNRKVSTTSLDIEVTFRDINRKISIKPPDTLKK